MSTLTSHNNLQVVTPDPSGTGGLAINNNFKILSTPVTAADPGMSDDDLHGFAIGSRWYNTTSNVEWICTNAATGSAVWVKVAGNPFNQSLNTSNAPTFSGLTLNGALNMGGSNISGGGTFTATTFVGSLTGHASLDLPLTGGTITGTVSVAGSLLNINSTFTNSAGQVNALVINSIYNQTATAGDIDLKIVRTENSLGSGSNQKFISCLVGTVSMFSVDHLGDVASSGTIATAGATMTTTGLTASSAIISGALGVTGAATASSFTNPNLAAMTTLYVDQQNNISGDGSILNPYASLTDAMAVATSGNLISLAAGTYDLGDDQAVLRDGVHLRGSGMDITIITSEATTSGMSPSIVPGTGSVISDLTINSTGNSVARGCIGCLDTATQGSTQFSANPSLYRVKCINTYWAWSYTHNNATSLTSYFYAEDSVFISNMRCVVNYLATDSNFTCDLVRCQLLFTYASGVAGSATGECLFQGARLFNCICSMTDTINTAWASVGYQMFDVDGTLELYGCTCITKFPNLPAIVPISVPGTSSGFMLTSNTGITKIGAGNTLSLPYSDIGPSLYQIMPSPSAYADSFPLTVASSAIAPWIEGNDALFEIAVDAGTLTSNTLTLSNVNVSNNATGSSVAIVDGQKFTVRVHNSNASSTAMTLSFGTTYNTGSWSMSTLAAGKTAYLSWCYNASTSKWDLRGYQTGM